MYENNYHCSEKGCGFKTSATSEAIANKQLIEAGGKKENKYATCPKCRKESLVFLPERAGVK